MKKSLKPVDSQKNPGLSQLPTSVRNKMGYMDNGGRVIGGFHPKSSSSTTWSESK